MPASKLYIALLATSSFISVVNSQNITRIDGTEFTSAQLDYHINRLMNAAQVHGLGISVFNKNKVVYKKAFGYKRFDTKETCKQIRIFMALL